MRAGVAVLQAKRGRPELVARLRADIEPDAAGEEPLAERLRLLLREPEEAGRFAGKGSDAAR
jgi:hypothetical protein